MSSCPSMEYTVDQVVGFMSEEMLVRVADYTDAAIVSSIKQYLIDVGHPLRDTADTFILFKGPEWSRLVEFANGCSYSFVSFDLTAITAFLGVIGNPI